MKVVQKLVEKDAYINGMESNDGKLTPLDYAISNNHIEIIEYLVCMVIYAIDLLSYRNSVLYHR